MKSSRFRYLLVLLVVLLPACGGGGDGGSSNNAATPALVSIAVTPPNPSISDGNTQQFVATGTYSDSSTKDVTTLVTWSSSNDSVAGISNAAGSNGIATSLSEGTTTIKATSGSIAGSSLLTVTHRDANVVAITVSGTGCTNSFLNKACVSVTVCSPDASSCQTINDILLDTGSFGLRIFKQALSVSLPAVTSGSGALAECVHFGDGSSEWGPVKTAGVILGNEPAIQVPIHVVDSTFGVRPTVCQNSETSPADSGFNGILGVGLFQYDCGSSCANSASNQIYYSCSGSSCSPAAVALVNQVQNPVALLPQDNNGVIVQLPGVAAGGAPSVTGNLVLGIATRSNNSPSGVTTFTANDSAEFTTVFNGSSVPGFIDSGSNGIFFPAPSASVLPVCSSTSDWFCPSATTSLSAVNVGASGSPSGTVPFQIANFMSLSSSANHVFNNIGGPFPGGAEFDWGLPFFLGRNVFVGIAGTKSPLGTGPYWAY